MKLVNFLNRNRVYLTLALMLFAILVPHLGATVERYDYGQADAPPDQSWIYVAWFAAIVLFSLLAWMAT